MKLTGGKIKNKPYDARATPTTSVVNDQSMFGFFVFMFLLYSEKNLATGFTGTGTVARS